MTDAPFHPFEIIDHTAEIGIAAYGRDLPEAFANAALGMFSLMVEPEQVTEDILREVRVEASDQEELLVRWLNELLFIFDTENLVFRRFEVTELTDTQMGAQCYGERVNPSRHQIKLGVKAATYHMLKIEQADKALRVEHPSLGRIRDALSKVQVILDV